MKPWANFLVRLGAAILVTLVLAPVVGLFCPHTHFHRVLTRTLQAALVIALTVRRGPVRMWPEKLRAMGLRGPQVARRALLGATVGFLAMALLLFATWALGGRDLQGTAHRLPLGEHLVTAILTGIFAAFFEELLSRGYLKDTLGGLASAAIFAAVHFIQPIGKTDPAPPGYDPLLAVKRLPELFEAWTDPRRATLGFSCLLVLGLALNRLRERTGTLFLGMGVHAGIILVIQTYRRVLVGPPKGSPWIWGDALMRGGGLLPLLALLLLLLASYRAPLPPWARA